MPFTRPTPQQLRDRIAAELDLAVPGADARQRRSVEGVLTRGLAVASHELHGHLDWNARQVLPDSADAELLDRHANIWGMHRRPASPAAGSATFAGSPGAVVPAGAELRRADGTRYTTIASAEIGGAGVVTIAIAAVQPGAIGNAAPGTTVRLVAPIAGVQPQATIGAGASGGRDVESDAGLRARLIERIQAPPHGGSAADYVRWTKAVVGGEAKVWVYPAWFGIGTVGVAFVMPDGSLPDAATLDQVQANLEVERPVTAEVLAFAPTLWPVAVTISAIPDTPEVRAAITAELADFFVREAAPGMALPLSRLRAAISAAAGEYSHTLIAPTDDLVPPTGAIARLGDITWSPS